jgi:surfactin synthase thioesterase subunit
MYRKVHYGRRWFPRPLAQPGAATVLCLAPPGHGPASFTSWPGAVDGIQIAPLQFPGDWDAQWWDDHETVHAQADNLVAELRLRPELRFALFAHGSSALVAYETALRLSQLDWPVPRRLIVSCCPAPQDKPQDWPQDKPQGGARREPTDDELFVEALRIFSELRANPLPSLVAMSVRGLRAEGKALRTYVADDQQRLGIPITVVGWRQEARGNGAAMRPWQDRGTVTPVELDGTIFSYAQAPRALMRILTDDGGADDGAAHDGGSSGL